MKPFLKFAVGVVIAINTSVVTAAIIKAKLETEQSGATISRHIYGQFAEHLGRGIYDGIWVGENSDIPNTRGIRNDVVTALKELKVPVVRWPGGCFADEYHWRDGIGPRDQRPVRKNNWWGGTPETNAFGTHEFFDFAQQIGTDAYVSVNMASSNPTEMREWIEYLTSTGNDTIANERRANGRDEPFPLPFVGIGNESWGCGGNMTPEYYSDLYRRFNALFHKNGTNFHMNNDNNAVRVASGANNLDTNWTDVVMGKAGHAMDAISLHFYTLLTGDWMKRNEASATGFSQDHWYEILYQASRMDDVLKQHIAVMDKHDPEKRIGLYVDEWGTWYNTEPNTNPGHLYQQNSLRDALVAATTLNIFHRHADRVRMANIAQLVNVLQAMLLTNGADMAKTPTYHVFRMYRPFQQATHIPVNIKSPQLSSGKNRFPAVTVSVAKTVNQSLVIAMANNGLDEQHDVRLNLGDIRPQGVSGELLTAERMDAHNIPGQTPAVSPVPFDKVSLKGNSLNVTLPPKSVVVMQLPL